MEPSSPSELEAWHLDHARRLRPEERNDPPWGEPMQAEEYAEVHKLFSLRLSEQHGFVSNPGDDEDLDVILQCGGCRFYMPLEGAAGADWGACANPRSDRAGIVVFEHHGCLWHSGREHD